MSFNVADLPAVQAQLQRDIAAANEVGQPELDEGALPPSKPTGSAYPAKRLALENGQYRVVDHAE